MGGEIFRTSPYRPWDPLSLLYKGYWSYPGVKRPGLNDLAPSSSPEVKERVELHIYFLSGHSWHVLGWTFMVEWLLSVYNSNVFPSALSVPVSHIELAAKSPSHFVLSPRWDAASVQHNVYRTVLVLAAASVTVLHFALNLHLGGWQVSAGSRFASRGRTIYLFAASAVPRPHYVTL